MSELLIIADDYTGALDSGVQLAECGAGVKVITNVDYDFAEREENVNVLVIDTETRHMASMKAAQIVGKIVKNAVHAGIPHIFKKTDSALRGNIGSELTAVLESSGEPLLPFIPAFPAMKRTTAKGIHYIDGEPLSCSVFRQDPFEPTIESSIPKIIAHQSEVPTRVIPVGGSIPECEEPSILIFDAETGAQIEEIVSELYRATGLRIMAGCAGLAASLPGVLHLDTGRRPSYRSAGNLLVANGSINPVTISQLDQAEESGFLRIHLSPEQKLREGYWETEKGATDLAGILRRCSGSRFCILDTSDRRGCRDTAEYAMEHGIGNDRLRDLIPSSLARVICSRIDQEPDTALMIMGGDTLMGFLREIHVTEVWPVSELFPGTVISRFRYRDKDFQVITKSGGFGKTSLLLDLAKIMVPGSDRDQALTRRNPNYDGTIRITNA